MAFHNMVFDLLLKDVTSCPDNFMEKCQNRLKFVNNQTDSYDIQSFISSRHCIDRQYIGCFWV